MHLIYTWIKSVRLLLLPIAIFVFHPAAAQHSLKLLAPIDTINFVEVYNRGQADVRLSFAINGNRFFSGFSEIAAKTLKGAVSGEDSVKRIWEFTGGLSYHYYPMSAHVWLHEPLVFLNSVGFGFCDDVAKVNEILWKSVGFDARTWFLNGHVVSEVFQGNKWKMLDSDLGCYYLDSIGAIASVEEIFSASHYVVKNRLQSRDRDLNFKESDWDYVRTIYDQKEGYIDVTSIDSVMHDRKVEFQLPPKSKLIIGDRAVDGFMTDVIESKHHAVPFYSNVILQLPDASNLSLDLPLIVQDIKGTGIVIINGNRYVIGSNELASLLLKRDKYIHSLLIEQGADLNIVFLFNRRLFQFSEQNEIEVFADNLEKIKLKRTKKKI